MSSRRNPIGRASAQSVIVVAVAGGLLAAAAGSRPTGSEWVDRALLFVAAAACVWSAASAPWWALVVTGAAATALAPSALLAVPAAFALGLPIVIGARRRNWACVRSVSMALAVQVLVRLDIGGFFGLSALIAISLLGVVFAAGLRRRSRRVRSIATRSLLGGAALSALAVIGFGISAVAARTTLANGTTEAHSGLDLLSMGDLAGAKAAFAQAHTDFAAASDALNAVWAQGARLVPVVAQNQNAAASLAAAASRASASISAIVDRIDLDSLTVRNGQIDLDAVRSFATPLADLRQVLNDLGQASAASDNPWLLSVIEHPIHKLTVELTTQRTHVDDALRAVQLVPDMLGGSGKRVYFIAFCTPAEARGSLGFMGNFAEVTADHGRLEMTRFGRTTTDLDPQIANVQRRITGLDQFMANYGKFGFNTESGGIAAPDVWLNVTVSADFPSTADVIAQLYPQTGGQHVDGVIAMDPTTLAALLQLTGPIEVDGVAAPITSANAVRYLLLDQYQNESNVDRIDTLEALAKSVTKALLSGPLAGPRALAGIFGPLARAGHILAWSPNPSEEALFTQFRADGALPALHGGDGIGMAFNNGSGNKIDNFLDADLLYASKRTATGGLTSTATITLHNAAPPTGYADYVIGNVVGLPPGSNRTYFTLYSATPVISATVSGTSIELTPGIEQDWHTSSAFLDLAPGSTERIVVAFVSSGPISSAPPVIIEPSLPRAATIAVTSSP